MSIQRNLSDILMPLPKHVKLVAVSKFQSVEAIREAYNTGQRIFGENRVQELVTKRSSLQEDVEWHFIGTLQTNKVKYIAPFVSMIESVDTLKLLYEIDRQAAKCNRIIPILLEVFIAEEESKHGFSTDECKALFMDDALKALNHIQVNGLMGMATFTDNQVQVRQEFKKLKALFDEIRALPETDPSQFTELSMGMSDDYQIAIEEGSTIVRIGTSIFGKRGEVMYHVSTE